MNVSGCDGGVPAHFIVGEECSPMSTSCSEDDKSSDDEFDDDERKVVVGVCAMAKKSNSRPMQEILERLRRFSRIEICVFPEATILNEPIENWPLCDCLISFHSKGFPLDKAVQYTELRKPYLINDIYMQYSIQDRCKVYRILADHGIEKPRYATLYRDSTGESQSDYIESDDNIQIDNEVFHKPFVEKPVNAEDHNVYIYFPTSAGGGSQRLFRKIGSRSSVYSPVSTVRKIGSFIYEEFMATDGTDVKVYTVGPDYAHAEARKSPALDGKVERDKDGKEIRYPVLLSAKEKMIARTVCLAFKQNVCGFDLLRANGKSFVCDVNGFSFVKTSPKYYDDCAKILVHLILRQLAPQLHIPYNIPLTSEDIPIVPTTSGTMMELRCVVAVVRHGDRTPKQKMKMEIRHPRFFELFECHGGYESGQLKLKHPKQLQEVLDIVRELLAEPPTSPPLNRAKLEQIKVVLEMYGHFSGINRKVQMKYQPHGAPKKCSSDDDDLFDEGEAEDNCASTGVPCRKYRKASKSSVETTGSVESLPREPSLVLILKWGGELTPAGKVQAEELGKAFRCMYPGGQGDYSSQGLGLLRLHSTFRHDLKIYASDEGRVQMTAAAFARGFLALEGELTPILVQMVKSANMNGLLDNDNESSKYQNFVKERLQAVLNKDSPFTEKDIEEFAPMGSTSIIKAMQFIGNPRAACDKMYEIMLRLLLRIKELKNDPKASELKLYHSESWELMQRRWSKLLKDYWPRGEVYDISKVPDIYDCIKFDILHNMKILRFPEAEELHSLAKAMADIVIPLEYGINREEKLLIGQCIFTPLLRKILADLQRNESEEFTRLDSRYSEGVSSPERNVKTRLYFTSESHIHSLLTMLRYGGLCNDKSDEQWSRAMNYVSDVSELNYMTQIVIMMYEDPTKDVTSDERFHVELHFSPGAYCVGHNNEYPTGRGYRPQHGERNQSSDPDAPSRPCVRDVATYPGTLSTLEASDNSSQSPDDGSPPPPHDPLLSDNTTQQSTQDVSEDVQSGQSSAESKSGDMRRLSEIEIEQQQQISPDDSSNLDMDIVSDSSTEPLFFKSSQQSTENIQQLSASSQDAPIKKSLPALSPLQSTDRIDSDVVERVDEISSPSSELSSPCPSCTPLLTGSSRQRVKIKLLDNKGRETLRYPSSHVSPSTSSTDLNSTRRRHQSSGSVENKTKVEEGCVGEEESKRRVCWGDEDSETTVSVDNKPVKETRSRSLETLQKREKKDHHHHHLHHHHHHHHHHHKDHNKCKRASFLSLFGSRGNLMDLMDGWHVPSLRPLETLHNALTLRQLEKFIANATEMHCKSPISSLSPAGSLPLTVASQHPTNEPQPLSLAPTSLAQDNLATQAAASNDNQDDAAAQDAAASNDSQDTATEHSLSASAETPTSSATAV